MVTMMVTMKYYNKTLPSHTQNPHAGPGCAANTCCGPQRVGNSDVVDSEGDLLIVTGNNSC